MESANVQVLRRMEELFNRRDLDAYGDLLDPAVEWHVAREDPDATVHHGPSEVRAYLEGWIDAFADLRIHMEAVKDEPGDRVSSVVRFMGHGTGSGAPFEERVNFVFSVRGGRVTAVEDLGQASTK